MPTKRRRRVDKPPQVVRTGSTLLDLAISGGIVPGGGVPKGIMVEVFGPSGCGKTVQLCEMAGDVLRQGGDVLFLDPEGRLNKLFARLFGLDLDSDRVTYKQIPTVTETFEFARAWKPSRDDVPNGIFVDSLAALTTKMEQKDSDKMGMRRAKEFSEQCRKTCRHISRTATLVVMSNQVRQNVNAGPYAPKYKTSGGEAIGFYSSLRLRCSTASKTWKKIKISGKPQKRVMAVETEVDVYKSSVWEPYHTAPLHIVFNYGVDDVRANLQYLKSYRGHTKYMVGDHSLGVSMERAITKVEHKGLEAELRSEVINLWAEVEAKFKVKRRPKRRY